ncbi:MAG TPA: cation transporting ATPase C-terminal domain-containing protein, partial [Polyangiaceae bacterium]|nr:cation transporting ATPase C-terminal domain-containing protein [Polyangiaceae bacterium]
TFLFLLYVLRCWDVSTPAVAAHSQSLFQTGWFVESLLTQTLIIHVIRTDKIPFFRSRASGLLTATSAAIMAIGVAIPFSPVGRYLGFTTLPPLYWLILAVTVASYMLLTQGVKMALLRRKWI